MTRRRVRIYGDPCLREESVSIQNLDTPELKVLIEDMIETMYEEDGLGLAAPQVGENIRLFVADTDAADSDAHKKPPRNPIVYINPQILEESPEDEAYDEGCLSLPDLTGQVYRPTRVTLRYTTPDGRQHEEAMGGMRARCVQHEIDHLDGKLFIDRMPFVRRRLLAGKLNALKRRQKEEATAKT